MDDSQRQSGYPHPESNGGIVSHLARQDKIPWHNKPNLRLLYLTMFPACLAVEMTTGFDASMINGLQSVHSWFEYFHHPRSALLGFMVGAYSLGFIAAIPFVPFVVDKMGRRYSILIGGVISIFGSALQGSALNATMFIISRFVLGFASFFGTVAASSLIGELSHPNERTVLGCLLMSTFDFGAMAAAGVILATYAMTSDWGWRIPSFLQVALSLLQVIFIWFIPESPRWLISKGRGSEAYAVLVKYHAEGDNGSEFAEVEYTQIVNTLEAEQKIGNTGWKDLFSTPGMRKRVSIAIFLGFSGSWSGIGLISYFISPILDSIGIHDNRTKNIFNVFKSSWGFVVTTVGAFIVPRYPRRKIFLTSTVSIFVIFTLWTVASAEYSRSQSRFSAQLVLALIFLYLLAFYLVFAIIIYTFIIELFPFHVRAKGFSVYHWCSRVAGFIGLVLNPIGMEVAGWKWYIVYCVMNAFQVIFVYFMLPETSGRTLEELTFLYENDEAVPIHSETETLCAPREVETHYGTMQSGSSRRTGQYPAVSVHPSDPL